MEKKIYLLTVLIICESDIMTHKTKPFFSLEEAKKAFADEVAKEKKLEESYSSEWIVDEDSDTEYSAGVDGYWCQDSARIFITEEVMEIPTSSVKLNVECDMDELGDIVLDERKHPVAFAEKVAELVEEEGMTQEEAEDAATNMEVPMELYYERGYGLFAVDSDAVDAAQVIYSPYTGLPCQNPSLK